MADLPLSVERLLDDTDPPTIRPTTTAAVSAAVTACASESVSIVPVGGDTGLSGGTELPDATPAVHVALGGLDAIRSVDADRWTITAEAGVTIQAVQEAAAAVGRQFAPDWGARGSATVGGAVSTDAGGHNVVRHGNMRENVLGLEVVLADGTVWDGLRALRKDSSGYDLKQLFIGGEGTLGIVTAAVLRLVPATPHRQSALAAIPDLDQLAALVELVRTASDGTLTAIELMPDTGLQIAADRLEIAHPLADTAADHVLVSLAAGEPVTDRLTAILAEATDRGLITDAVFASSGDQEAALWQLRDMQSPTQSRPELVDESLKYDAAVPVDRIADLVRVVGSHVRSAAPGAEVHAFGHVGDGNIHLWVLPGTDPAAFAAQRKQLRDDIDAIVFAHDGTLSAEHGIGTLLRDRIGDQKPPIEWDLMRRIKHTLDPGNIFNPGKTLPDQST